MVILHACAHTIFILHIKSKKKHPLCFKNPTKGKKEIKSRPLSNGRLNYPVNYQLNTTFFYKNQVTIPRQSKSTNKRV